VNLGGHRGQAVFKTRLRLGNDLGCDVVACHSPKHELLCLYCQPI
jgi:hypothetical protein